jgi:hypothetical protein
MTAAQKDRRVSMLTSFDTGSAMATKCHYASAYDGMLLIRAAQRTRLSDVHRIHIQDPWEARICYHKLRGSGR